MESIESLELKKLLVYQINAGNQTIFNVLVIILKSAS